MSLLRNMLKLKNKNVNERYLQLKENVIHSQHLAQIGSWTYDIKKDEVFWTEEIYHILECEFQGLKDRLESFLSYVHPDDRDKVEKATQDVFKGEEYDIEFRIITSMGQERYLHEKTKTIYDENKIPIKVVGIIQDITNRKIIENDLKALGDDLNHAQRVAGVGSWKYDLLKNEFHGSEEMYRIYGINPQDHKKDFNSTVDLVHPEDRIKIRDAMKKHMAGESCTLEFRIPQQDGKVKYVIGKGEPIFNQTGEVVGVLGTLQDITEKKEQEKAIQLKQKEIEQLQKNDSKF